MILYNLLLIIILILNLIKTKILKEVLFNLIFIIMVLIVGLRSLEIGSDTKMYVEVFRIIRELEFNQIYMEKGYLIYNYIISYLTKEVWFFLFISAIFMYSVIYNFIKKNSSNKIMSLYLFVSLRYFGQTMNITRQMLAFSFLLIGFEFLKKEKKIYFFLFNLIGICFHKSSVAFILIFFLKNLKFKKIYIQLSIIISGIFLLFSNLILKQVLKFNLLSNYRDYLTSKFFSIWDFGIIFNVMVSFIVMLSYYFYYIKDQKDKEEIINLKMWICTLSYLLSSFSLMGNVLSRVALYFMLFNIIIIPDILKEVKNRIIRRFCYFFIILLFFSYHLITLYLKPEWNYIYPYKFYWMS